MHTFHPVYPKKHRANTRLLFLPLKMVTLSACVCLWRPGPTKSTKTWFVTLIFYQCLCAPESVNMNSWFSSPGLIVNLTFVIFRNFFGWLVISFLFIFPWVWLSFIFALECAWDFFSYFCALSYLGFVQYFVPLLFFVFHAAGCLCGCRVFICALSVWSHSVDSCRW